MTLAAIYLVLAFSFGMLSKLIGLPPLIGYLVAGFSLGAYGYDSDPVLHQISEAGVLLLLFSVGLKLRLRSLLQLEVIAGSMLHLAISATLTAAFMYFMVGINMQQAILIAIALSFSSTVFAAKLLESKNELRAFHGRVAIGILILQDLVAVAFLSLSGGHSPSPWALSIFALPLIRPIAHKLLDLSGHDEVLILFGLVLAVIAGGITFEHLGLSPELGALLLGALLANHSRATELSDAIWGLKEVLLVGFFLQIGMSGQPSWESLAIALAFCLAIPLKAILFFLILVIFRLRARSSFLTGLSLATYSEFGLIVASLGVENQWIEQQWLIILAMSVAISFVISAPVNRFAHSIYSRLEKYLVAMESRRRHPDDEPIHLGNSHILIMGMGRVGTGAYDFLCKRQQRVIGLDSDPSKLETHRAKGRRVLYADAEDPGLWQNLDLHAIQAVLLAMPDLEANTIAARQLRQCGFQGHVSATAVYPEELEIIREAGADVVYNYYQEVGVGFAELVWEEVFTEQAQSN